MSEKNYIISAYILLAAVLTAGLFVPLMNNDAGALQISTRITNEVYPDNPAPLRVIFMKSFSCAMFSAISAYSPASLFIRGTNRPAVKTAARRI